VDKKKGEKGKRTPAVVVKKKGTRARCSFSRLNGEKKKRNKAKCNVGGREKKRKGKLV